MPELIEVFNQLIRLEPENDAYYFDKANAQFLANQLEAAKKTYDEIGAKFGESRELVNAKRRFQANGSATKVILLNYWRGTRPM